jgi:hypothetical protein
VQENGRMVWLGRAAALYCIERLRVTEPAEAEPPLLALQCANDSVQGALHAR